MKTRKLLSVMLAMLAFTLCVGAAVPALAATGVQASNAEIVKAANRLYMLGLFSGVGNNADDTPNFELDKTLNRQEAVTMLIRLLGKEDEAQVDALHNAKSGMPMTPFTDVESWAEPYVSYAYENGLTSGTSATTFGGTENVSATQYLTFVLRALGYSSDTDFAWSAAWELTDELGITNGEYGEGSVLVRGEAVLISANALDVTMKDGSKTLLEAVGEEIVKGYLPAWGEVLYDGVPLSQFLAKPLQTWHDTFGEPDSPYSGGNWFVEYEGGFILTVDMEYPYVIRSIENITPSMVELNGVTLDKTRDELAGVFGEPSSEYFDDGYGDTFTWGYNYTYDMVHYSFTVTCENEGDKPYSVSIHSLNDDSTVVRGVYTP